MTWQERGSFIMRRIVAMITALVIIAIVRAKPELLAADGTWLEQHAEVILLSLTGCAVALIFQYWSTKMIRLGWLLLIALFAWVTLG